MIRLLHTADWQIGKPFGQFEPDEAALLSEARFLAVERLAMLATEHQVDAVLVAGDVFDAQTVADKTLHRLFNALAGFSGPWVMIPGNHDAALAESVWRRAERLDALPANLHLCLRPEPLHLEAANLVVLPAPLTQRHTYQDLTDWFDLAATPEGALRIGLAHGSVEGILIEAIDSPNPIALDRADKARLDYLALGDWHGAKRIDARSWYAGTPEPDRFKANDAGRALLVELDAPGTEPRVTQLETGRYRWRQETRTLRVASDLDALLEWLGALDGDDVVALILEGSLDLAAHRRLEIALGQARGRARSLRVDTQALRLEPTVEDLDALAADGYVGEVIDELREQQGGSDGAVARDALALLAGLLDERREKRA